MTTPTLLPLPEEKIARRAARFINRRFSGNVAAAAEAIGCSYQRLWKLCGGDYRRTPPIDLLMKLSEYSKRDIRYWLGVTVGDKDDE
jgi:hypothetical protein